LHSTFAIVYVMQMVNMIVLCVVLTAAFSETSGNF